MALVSGTERVVTLASWGRVKGRKMRPGRAALFDRLLPPITIKLERDNAGTVKLLDLTKIFGKDVQEIWLEVGVGGGEHLMDCARKNPEVGVIGCEPFLEGVGKLLSRINTHQPQNIRIFPGDVRVLLSALPPACLAKVFVLFPDPWPKKRHHKRRLFQQSFIEILADSMASDAHVIVSTDHVEYARWILNLILQTMSFSWQPKTAKDWRCRPLGTLATRYEAKAQTEGRRIIYLKFRRTNKQAALT